MPRYPALSHASDGLTTRVYTGLLGLAKAHAREVFALNVGDTFLLPPECARSESLSVVDLPQLHNYADVRGEPVLIDAIVRDLASRDRPVEREHLQVTSGATSGLDLIARTLLSPGDEAIVLAPFWPLIRGVVSATGATAVELPFFTELAKPDFDLERALEGALSPRTTALYLNTPHNPTGVVLEREQLDAIARFITRHDLWLICDEAYDQLFFDAAPPAPLWTRPDVRERCVVAHTLSKTYAMAGARIGFVHGPSKLMEALSGLQTFATYCAPKPMQLGAARALAANGDPPFPRLVAKSYAEGANLAAKTLGLVRPSSGPFMFFDTRPFLAPGETPTQWLERCARAGVVMTPGGATGSAYGAWARLCYTCVEPPVLGRAMSVLSSALQDSAGATR